jgi:hypothetical protein
MFLLQDCHTVGHYAPVVDSSQDWHLLSGMENNFGTVLKFTRKLDTCDDKDTIITVSKTPSKNLIRSINL